ISWTPSLLPEGLLQHPLSQKTTNTGHQTSVLWTTRGQNATMDCRHNMGTSYYQMYWYRQLPMKTMEQIVFTRTGSKDHDFGTFSTEKFAATKTVAEHGTFTVKHVEPGDEGLYFCAVSAQ
uniref:Ig-like domain-containing protein n=1 Tax=Gouania willdenowi TaxID=441366 RepID=A0A8C5G1I3_GOUWI